MDLWAISSAESKSLSNMPLAADCAYKPPEPIAITPSSISIQFPEPSTSTVISGSLTTISADSWAWILFVLHCLASDRHALSVYPGYFSNSFSSSSTRARQSAAEPANPQITLSYILRIFFAVFLNTVGPSDIWPSAIMATCDPFLTLSTVVLWNPPFSRLLVAVWYAALGKVIARFLNLYPNRNIFIKYL